MRSLCHCRCFLLHTEEAISMQWDKHKRNINGVQWHTYLLVELTVHSNLLRLIRDMGKWGMSTYVLPSARYTVTTRMNLH